MTHKLTIMIVFYCIHLFEIKQEVLHYTNNLYIYIYIYTFYHFYFVFLITTSFHIQTGMDTRSVISTIKSGWHCLSRLMYDSSRTYTFYEVFNGTNLGQDLF